MPYILEKATNFFSKVKNASRRNLGLRKSVILQKKASAVISKSNQVRGISLLSRNLKLNYLRYKLI